jgi:hypothetical protein
MGPTLMRTSIVVLRMIRWELMTKQSQTTRERLRLIVTCLVPRLEPVQLPMPRPRPLVLYHVLF